MRSHNSSPQPADAERLHSNDAFRYTSGRWLYNECKRLRERELPFSISALAKVAATAIGRDETDVQSITKLAEGGFNRVFKLTINDGSELIARLPYPSTQPKHLAVASEVATMDLARSYGVPVPKIHDYSSDTVNPVGTEYIIMEHVRGRLLGDIWFTLLDKERIKVLSEIVDVEAKLFEIDLPAYGSIFYDGDLPDDMGRTPVESRFLERFCIGPDASLKFWFEERSALKIKREPSKTAADVLERVAVKEMAWLRAHGKPRWPLDRVYRDITNYEKSDPQEHINNLDLYKQVAARLVPKDEWLHRPTLRHPDLNPNNIFVSENHEIIGIIDWQHSNVLPLFLNAGIPAHLQNYGDPDSENLVQPQSPPELEELDAEDQAKELELYRRRHTHFYYVAATAKKLDLHFQALMHEGGRFGFLISKRADLVSQEVGASALSPCPFAFDDGDAEKALNAITKQEEAEDQIGILRNAIGISSDGWVSKENYEEAVTTAAEMKAQALEYADDDFEREMTERHWPFDDHDEEE